LARILAGKNRTENPGRQGGASKEPPRKGRKMFLEKKRGVKITAVPRAKRNKEKIFGIFLPSAFLMFSMEYPR